MGCLFSRECWVGKAWGNGTSRPAQVGKLFTELESWFAWCLASVHLKVGLFFFRSKQMRFAVGTVTPSCAVSLAPRA